MTPHPKTRKTVKWGGAAVTVLLVVVWIGSGWWSPMLTFRHGFLHVHGGCASVVFRERAEWGWTFSFERFERPLYWRWQFSRWGTPRVTYTDIPLWPFATASLLCTSLAWYRDSDARRRARLNLCPNCNYDRTGLAAGAVCPECGRSPS